MQEPITDSDRRDQDLGRRWEFLEGEADACAVVTRRMEVVYLNAAGRSLVPDGWLGERCWNVFPVGSAACAAACPAIRAVSAGCGIEYCEETIYPGGEAVRLGVAVVPLDGARTGPRAILRLRPIREDVPRETFRAALLADAAAMAVPAAAGPAEPA
jgi:hypothetical protein